MSVNVNNTIGIGSISASYGAYKQKLTRETQQKLDENNIPYKPNITEQEAKQLLASKGVKENAQAKSQNDNQNEENSSNNLMERTLELAKKIGINADKNDDFKALLNKIEIKLKELIESSKGDINELKELKGYSLELANIQAQANGSEGGYNNSNQALMMSLEMMSRYNKNMLNL